MRKPKCHAVGGPVSGGFRHPGILPVAVLYAVMTVAAPMGAGAQRPSMEMLLLRENRMLRREVDSLRRELERAQAEDILWAGLSGLEEDLPGRGSGFSSLTGFEVDAAAGDLTAALSRLFPEMSLPFHPSVAERVAALSRGKAAVRLDRSRSRLEGYLPLFRETFSRRGVPPELIPLCVVESAVSPRAVSPAGAAGMWQLMPATARQYGLRVDGVTDERFDVVRSTDAAARLLADLRRSLGNWPLAVMAYNCGAGRVKGAVVRAGGTDPWEVWKYVPAETQAYLPSLLAVGYMMEAE
jgi:Soluble lytic murein transglycosylase and related regulatory proteins (some contain LysM/invasin domains)